MNLNKEGNDAEMTRIVGLTGGIGTGKSTAAGYLKARGFAHIDADEIGRQITADGSDMLPVLDAVFGPEGELGEKDRAILDEKGSLDRKTLADIVFTDAKKKARLDEVMFRAITAEIDRQIELLQKENDSGMRGILLDAPLLFEAGLDGRCDCVLVLVADETVRIDRVCRRDGATAQEVRNRINSQMSDNEKIKKSDFVIDNSEGLEELEENLDEFLAAF